SEKVFGREPLKIGRDQLPAPGDRLRLLHLVPIAEVVTPELLLEGFGCTREPLGDLLRLDRHHRAVAESVQVSGLHRAEEGAVASHRLAETADERLRLELLFVESRWARIVDRVGRPGAGTR